MSVRQRQGLAHGNWPAVSTFLAAACTRRCRSDLWRATHSHCSLLHGYALSFAFVFATRELDEHNWCFDFGGLKEVKAWLHHMFDHTTLAAADDPHLTAFESLQRAGLAELRVLPAVGCEAVARYAFDHVSDYVVKKTSARVWLESVEVREHSGNSAIYCNPAGA
ncbi:6-pyruvoyl trahydropterin synthase family protein [Bradyrhizobium sp. CCBAU 21359]|uniref:6-pyruvoyl trahydropterin synthase family protein n=1 Tax=Bradyrhizobium sp. CCBAU 21359 TaxID=1325080 RepID=UPI00230516F3|nr:6-carboxytetrahydropterin synthase [Bradyrhizobium sp. CCBAU 21359]